MVRSLRKLLRVVAGLGALVLGSSRVTEAIPINGIEVAGGEIAPAEPPLAPAAVAVEQGICSAFINFDGAAAPCLFSGGVALRNEFLGQGVAFSHTNNFDGGAVLDECGGFGVNGHSSPNFLAFNCNAVMPDGGTARAPEILTFTNLVGFVSMNVGSSAGSQLTMEAYDENGQLLATASVGASPAVQQLSICSAGIKRVIVGPVSPCIWVLDDLCFVEVDINVEEGSAVAGQAVGIRAQVEFTPTIGNLFFRSGGSTAAFTSVPMTVNGNIVDGIIPAGSVNGRGIEYFIQVDGFICTLNIPGTAPGRPAFLPVRFANERLTPVPPPETFILTGLPFVPDNPDPGGVLVDDLGGYNIRRWRFGRFNPADSTYSEFPATPGFAPGLGYWLIMRDPEAVGAAGASTNSVETANITIQPGWNQIADPFLFRVDLAAIDFSIAPNVDQRLVAFEGGGYVDKNVLEPWRGYWMFNGGGSDETIGVPGDESGASPRATPETVAELEFGIEASVRQGAAWDRGNVAGVSAAASEAVDAFDRREPPALPGFASAYFQREDHGAEHALTADFVSLNGEGARWTLVVDAPGEVPARLAFEGLDTVPEELTVALWPADGAGREIDLRREERELVVPPGRAVYHLAVGSADYLAKTRDEVGSAPPAAVALDFASKNPFREEIALVLDLPQRSEVDLRIYDVQGRLVQTLAERSLGSGRHTLLWDGRDRRGGKVAAGTFFADLRVGTARIHRKLLLLR